MHSPQQVLAKELSDLGLPDARESERPAGHICAKATGLKPGVGMVMPHRPHLARWSGQGDDHATVRARDEPSGRRPVRVGQRNGGRDQPRLLAVGLRERHRPAGPHVAQPRLLLGVHDRCLAAHPGDRLARQVVRRGSQATGGHDEIGPAQAGGERFGHHIESIGDGRHAADDDACRRQRCRELSGVGVSGLADGDLRADAQELHAQETAIRGIGDHALQRNGPVTSRAMPDGESIPRGRYHRDSESVPHGA